MDPRWGRVILPSLPSLAPPMQEGSGNQTNILGCRCLEYDKLTGSQTFPVPRPHRKGLGTKLDWFAWVALETADGHLSPCVQT